MLQLIQIAGALSILAAFVAGQAGVLRYTSLSYLALNLVGAAVLAALAYLERQWGFLLLEGAWALVAAYGLIARGRRSKDRPRGATNETCARRRLRERPTMSSAGGASS